MDRIFGVNRCDLPGTTQWKRIKHKNQVEIEVYSKQKKTKQPAKIIWHLITTFDNESFPWVFLVWISNIAFRQMKGN